MGIVDSLLAPFRKWFCPPVLNTPMSTIPIPPPLPLMILVCASFCVISGGCVYCIVRDIPMTGYTRTRDGKNAVSWIDMHGISSQFMSEGIVIGMLFCSAGVAFMCALCALKKDVAETPLDEFVKGFGYTAPLWCFLAYYVFNLKVPSFRPSFTANS
jgi:hypothetical protein